MNLLRPLVQLTPLAALCAALPALATNGMLMEGYGPVSTGMGGASQAFDHGTAAMAQNPATLALMPTRARHDAALGVLGPKVASSMAGMGSAESDGTSYVMPALGYARRTGSLIYGFGLFAQGGMGTEYGADSFLAMGSGNPVRSELGVGSLLFPLAWQATPALLVAADVKRIAWSDVMKDFRLRYDSAGMGGSVSFALPQNWKDQSVLNLGLAYAVGDQLTLRAGVNRSDNPIPDALVNPLFPATVKSHYTLGVGWRFSATGELNGSLTVAPTSTVTNGMGVVVTHKQTNFQIMYSRHFI